MFNKDELLLIKQRFDKFADKNILKAHQFRDSLGLLGLEQQLSDRIFAQIDSDKDGQINFENFLQYLNMLLNGTPEEKALFSFKLLTQNNKNYLEIEDLELMIYEVCYLWNSITGSNTIPKKELIQEIFSVFDQNNDGLVSFNEFKVIYSEGVELIGWYEFLNSEDINLARINIQNGKKKKRATLLSSMGQNEQKDILQVKLKLLQQELISTADMIKTEKEKEKSKIIYLESFDNGRKPNKSLHGPQFNDGQIQQMWGDDDPEFQQEPLFKNEQFHTINDRFQNLLMNRLRYILVMSEEIKKINNQQKIQIIPPKSEVIRQLTRKKSTSPIRDVSPNLTQDEIQIDDVKKNIYFGHENWNLVLNMMLGIRKAIKTLHPMTEDIVITGAHYKVKHQFEIITKRTQEFDFRKSCYFYEYAPMIFERIRKMFYITNDDFLRSIGPEQLIGDLIFCNLSSLTEKVSSGKSGSFFYSSYDDKYMLKTISRDEYKYLKVFLPNYYNHLLENFNSLIIKILGLYKMKILRSKTKYQKIYFVVMKNIFGVDQDVAIKYDLKGSLYQRTSRVKGKVIDKNIPLKDLDWIEDKQRINISKKDLEILKTQLSRDILLFEQNRIIDYSLLVGIIPNYREIDMGEKRLLRFYEQDYGGILSIDKKQLYIIGIIDIFTEFNNKKQLESKLKQTFIGKDVSCMPPSQYAERFKKFIFQSLY